MITLPSSLALGKKLNWLKPNQFKFKNKKHFFKKQKHGRQSAAGELGAAAPGPWTMDIQIQLFFVFFLKKKSKSNLMGILDILYFLFF